MTMNAMIKRRQGGVRTRALCGASIMIGTAGSRSSFGPSPAELKQYFATGRVPREQDFTTLLQIAEIGRLITGQNPDQESDDSNSLTIGPTGKFEVTPEFLAGLVSVQAFETLPIEDRRAIYELLVASGSVETSPPFQARIRPVPSVFELEGPVGPPIEDLLTSFAEKTVQLEGDFSDLIDIADVGRRAAGLAPGQTGYGSGMTIDPATGRMDFSPEILGGLVSIGAFARLAQPDLAIIYDLLRFSRTVFPEPPQSGQQFGARLALSGDGTTLAVADISRTVDGFENAGAVDIYRKAPEGWYFAQTIENPTPATNYQFGYTLSLPDSGTGYLTISGHYQASIKLYVCNGPDYVLDCDLTSSVSDTQLFETSVRINGDGNVVAAGYRGSSSPDGQAAAGRISVFTLEASSGAWNGPTTVVPSPSNKLENFGNSVAFDKTGSLLVVGAFKYDNPVLDCGRVYAFKKTNDSWQQIAIISPPDPKNTGLFGMAVSVSGNGNTIAIKSERVGSDNFTGYYLACRDEETGLWDKLDVVSGPEFGDRYFIEGNAAILSADGSRVALPAPVATIDELNQAGAVYFYAYSPGTGWIRERTLLSPDPEADYQFGTCIGASSDLGLIAAGEPNRPIAEVESAGCVSFFPSAQPQPEAMKRLASSCGDAPSVQVGSVSADIEEQSR